MKLASRFAALATLFASLPGSAFAAEEVTFEVLHKFTSAGLGLSPYGGLLKAADGKLYGTTSNGPGFLAGVFSINPDGSAGNKVHTFVAATEGLQLAGTLIEPAAGTLLGTAQYGGTNNLGTVFSMTSTGTVTVLHHAAAGEPNNLFHSTPVLASDGYLYVVAPLGGANSYGGIIRVQPDGNNFSVRHTNTVGEGKPQDGLMQASNGLLYGVTFNGGLNGGGSIYSLDAAGTYANVYSFQPANAREPLAGVIQASDGMLYGTVSNENTNNAGAVYRLNPNGSGFQILHTFATTDGKGPNGRLLEAQDGRLYGLTESGGANNAGVIFRLNKDGTGFVVLHEFDGADEGKAPGVQALVETEAGVFAGMTLNGGISDGGIIFQLKVVKLPDPPAANVAPTLTVSGPKTLKTTSPRVTLRGKASDPEGAVTILAKVGGKTFRTTTTKPTWKVVVKVKSGRTVVKVTAVDSAGATSPTRRVTIRWD